MTKPGHNPAPRQDDPPYQKGEPAALFIPCYIDQFYPQIAEATARLLARHGVPVVFPEKQTCCGQPAFNSGYWEQARKVIHHFCDVFAEHRWIVCPSPMRSATERLTWKLWAWAMCGPKRYRLAMWAVRLGVRLVKFVPRFLHFDKLGAWTRGRELPQVPGPAFRSRWKHNHQPPAAGSNPQSPIPDP